MTVDAAISPDPKSRVPAVPGQQVHVTTTTTETTTYAARCPACGYRHERSTAEAALAAAIHECLHLDFTEGPS